MCGGARCPLAARCVSGGFRHVHKRPFPHGARLGAAVPGAFAAGGLRLHASGLQAAPARGHGLHPGRRRRRPLRVEPASPGPDAAYGLSHGSGPGLHRLRGRPLPSSLQPEGDGPQRDLDHAAGGPAGRGGGQPVHALRLPPAAVFFPAVGRHRLRHGSRLHADDHSPVQGQGPLCGPAGAGGGHGRRGGPAGLQRLRGPGAGGARLPAAQRAVAAPAL